MRTIAISNYKGGVGKTTTAVNLAHVYASQGSRVLLVDLDPQASATDFFGLYDKAQETGRGTIGLLYGKATVADSVFTDEESGIHVIPSIIDLIDQNELLLHEQTLKFALEDAAGDFDVAIIDCSPVMKRLATWSRHRFGCRQARSLAPPATPVGCVAGCRAARFRVALERLFALELCDLRCLGV